MYKIKWTDRKTKLVGELFGKPPHFITRLDVSFSERKAL